MHIFKYSEIICVECKSSLILRVSTSCYKSFVNNIWLGLISDNSLVADNEKLGSNNFFDGLIFNL